ncbi:MAG: DUF3738 domain-containing protein [Cytophagales bacterium]|nr:DUF3738 domain-containing protein [Cytophagales bacterium]
MKIKNIYILIGLFFACVGTLTAQQPLLNVGDAAPAISALKWVKGEPVTALEKGKVHVLEFGATWCKPCIAAIPHISELAEKYGEKVNVMSWFVMEFTKVPESRTNPPYLDRVERFVTKQGEKMRYKVAVDDIDRTMERIWLKPTGVTGVPHTFIVDRNGYIAWIGVSTQFEAVDEMVAYVTSADYDLQDRVQQSQDVERQIQQFDPALPFLVDGNGGKGKDYMFRSLLRKSKTYYKVPKTPFISSQGWFDRSLPSYHGQKGLAQFVNITLLDLYYAAYGDTLYYTYVPFTRNPYTLEWPDSVANPNAKRLYGVSWHEPVLEVQDPSPFGPLIWRTRKPKYLGNKYDYSVEVPEDRASAGYLQEVMQRDLMNYFGYEVSVETRPMPCWKLTATKKAKKLLETKTPGESFRETFPDDGSYVYKNAIVEDIIWSLASKFGIRGFDYGYLPPEKQAPFVDATGLDIEIDYTFQKSHHTDFGAFKAYLDSMGLKLERSTTPMKVVVIRDPDDQKMDKFN